MKRGMVRVVAAFVVVLAVLGMAGAALAVDAPRWVAALYIDAQKSVGLRWMPVVGATGYKVLRSETKGSGYAEIGAVPAPQYFDQKVEAGSTYYYVLQAVAGAEVSANSDEKSLVIPGEKKKAIKPPEWRQVQDQQTTEFGKTSFKVGLSWTKINDAVAYNIYRSEAAGKDYQLLGSSAEDSYVDAAVQEGKTYYYVITALDSGFQETPYSSEKSVALVKKADTEKKELLVANKLVMKTSKELFVIPARGEGYSYGGSPDLALDSEGNIYCPQLNSGYVLVFSADGKYQRTVGKRGQEPGQLWSPAGVAFDADDNLYVADSGTNFISIFKANGTFVRRIPLPAADEEYMKNFNKAVTSILKDVAVAKDGRIYAIDNNLHRIVLMENDGTFVKNIGKPGGEPGQLTFPGWLAIKPDQSELHVCNGLNRRMEVFDLEGNFIRNYGFSKNFVGSFVGATGVAFDESGNSITVDGTLSVIQIFGPKGEYLYHVAGEVAEIDKESKQRSTLMIGGPSGVVYNPDTKAIIYNQNITGVRTINARVLTQK